MAKTFWPIGTTQSTAGGPHNATCEDEHIAGGQGYENQAAEKFFEIFSLVHGRRLHNRGVSVYLWRGSFYLQGHV